MPQIAYLALSDYPCDSFYGSMHPLLKYCISGNVRVEFNFADFAVFKKSRN